MEEGDISAGGRYFIFSDILNTDDGISYSGPIQWRFNIYRSPNFIVSTF